MNNQKRLEEVKVGKLLFEFSIPAIIGMMVNILYNIIDRIFIGHIKGGRRIGNGGCWSNHAINVHNYGFWEMRFQ